MFIKQTWGNQPADQQSITSLYAAIEAEQTRLLSEAQSARINTHNNPAVYYSQLHTFPAPRQFQANPRFSQNNSRSFNQRPMNYNNQNNYQNGNRNYQNYRPNFQRNQNNFGQNSQFNQNRFNAPRPNYSQPQGSQPHHAFSAQRGSSGQPRFNGPRNQRGHRGNNRNSNSRAHLTEFEPQAPYYDAQAFTAYTSDGPQISKQWIVDSGASNHFCNSAESFFNYTDFQTPQVIKVGGSETLRALGIGTILLEVNSTPDPIVIELGQVLYAPGLRKNLVSLSGLLASGWSVNANQTAFTISNETQTLQAHLENGLHSLNANALIPSKDPQVFLSVLKKNPSLQEAHEAFGHINKKAVSKILSKNGLKYHPDRQVCEPCLQGKMNRVSYRPKPITAAPV